MNRLFVLLLPLVGSQLVSQLAPMTREWYDSLQQSPITPPGHVFGVVWTGLYLLIGVALVQGGRGINWLWLNLLLNFLWLIVFNYCHNVLGGLAILFLMLLTLLRYIQLSENYLMFPYLLWNLVALYLNLYIVQNN